MLPYSYPIRTFIEICLVSIVIGIVGCRRDTEKVPPVIQLVRESGYTSDSVTVPIGYPYKIGIIAQKGDAAITNLVVTLTSEKGVETALDSGMYASTFKYEKSISYSDARSEKWSFYIRDKNGKSAITFLTIWKDTTSTYGAIVHYPSVLLCNQGSAVSGSFLSLSDGSSYTLENATANQSNINIITYWGDQVTPATGFTLSSPGEANVALYYPMISNWALPLNETRYKADSVSVSHEAFDAAYNDSIIIANYSSATQGKRKFKMLREGYVVPFQISAGTGTGRRGLIKINSFKDGIDGYINAEIKVQK